MLDIHREIIKTFIDSDIRLITMYWGYKADMVLKLVTPSIELATEIEDATRKLGGTYTTKYDRATKSYMVHVIAVDEDIIKLKDIK